MSIDFGKFKKKPEVEQEMGEEKVSDIASDKIELSDKSDIICEKKSDNQKITIDHLRGIYIFLMGKSDRKSSKSVLQQKLINILKKGEINKQD